MKTPEAVPYRASVTWLIEQETARLARSINDLVLNTDDLAKRGIPPMSYVNGVQAALDNIRHSLIRIDALKDAQ